MSLDIRFSPPEPVKCWTCKEVQHSDDGHDWVFTLHGRYCSPECQEVGWKEYQLAHDIILNRGGQAKREGV